MPNQCATVSSSIDSAIIRIERNMDFRLYALLRELVNTNRSKTGFRYVFDWSHTRHLHDSGVATLLQFREWAAEQNAIIEFANLNAEVQSRFREVREFAHLVAGYATPD